MHPCYASRFAAFSPLRICEAIIALSPDIRTERRAPTESCRRVATVIDLLDDSGDDLPCAASRTDAGCGCPAGARELKVVDTYGPDGAATVPVVIEVDARDSRRYRAQTTVELPVEDLHACLIFPGELHRHVGDRSALPPAVLNACPTEVEDWDADVWIAGPGTRAPQREQDPRPAGTSEGGIAVIYLGTSREDALASAPLPVP